MKNFDENKKTPRERFHFGPWVFPAIVAVGYLILAGVSQDRTMAALQASGRVFAQAVLPLLLAFVMMFLLNLFVTPALVSRYLGHGTGAKGVLLSSVAGIVSMGPIFSWYPFLKVLREKGASDFHLANFLAHRAVKPVLLPLMIVYFGWRFSLVFSAVGVIGALLAATIVGMFDRKR
jgi:uncharacterized membrane protein YraQ (UPF0718 family)